MPPRIIGGRRWPVWPSVRTNWSGRSEIQTGVWKFCGGMSTVALIP